MRCPTIFPPVMAEKLTDWARERDGERRRVLMRGRSLCMALLDHRDGGA